MGTYTAIVVTVERSCLKFNKRKATARMQIAPNKNLHEAHTDTHTDTHQQAGHIIYV